MFGWLTNRYRLEAIEIQFLKAVGALLPENAAALLHLQMSQIHFVQRIDGGKEVNFYPRSRNWRSDSLFPILTEFELAQAQIGSGELNEWIEVKLYCIEGHIFSLEYSLDPDAILGGGDLRLRSVEIVDVRMSGKLDGADFL